MNAQESIIFDYASDLHINHYVKWIPNQQKWEARTRAFVEDVVKRSKHPLSTVLILAGDFSEWNCQSFWLIDEFSKHYEHVFYVTGNHDMYLLSKEQRKKYKNDSLNRLIELKSLTDSIGNVTCLNGRLVEYEGKRIAGHSLWYEPITEMDWDFYRTISKDSEYIVTSTPFDEETWKLVEVPLHLYQQAMNWYASLADVEIDLMVTHVPPKHPAIENNPHKKNACYDANIEKLIAKKWVCGHQHFQDVFEMEGVSFYVNSFGYPDEPTAVELQTASF